MLFDGGGDGLSGIDSPLEGEPCKQGDSKAGDVVWEFVIPERAPYARYESVKALHARRIDPGALEFLDR